MPAEWKIEIVDGASPGAPARFRPDLPEAKEGVPLQANTGDEVFWVNTTRDNHQIQISEAQFQTDVLPPGEPSTSYTFEPGRHGNGQAVQYFCKLHPEEQGKIVVPTNVIT